MTVKKKYDGFGFCPDESEHHFLVIIPASNREDVIISEYLTYNKDEDRQTIKLGFDRQDGKPCVILARSKWNGIADEVRIEFNRRLKLRGIKTGRWITGTKLLSRLLGKELVLLAWAIEDADPGLIPTAIKNWLGLVPEERWWLFTMTNAATGHALYRPGQRMAQSYQICSDRKSGKLPAARASG